MLVVEGPDGSGKTTLANHLSRTLGWKIAPKVVSSNTMALVNLQSWVEDNVKAGFQRTIFDRHRLISGPIYSSVMRAQDPDRTELYDVRWVQMANQLFWDSEPIVIFCLPPALDVKLNVTSDEDNVVVSPFIDSLYRAYVGAAGLMLNFPRTMLWDYTQDHSLHQVADWVWNQL